MPQSDYMKRLNRTIRTGKTRHMTRTINPPFKSMSKEEFATRILWEILTEKPDYLTGKLTPPGQ